jgi:plastocyanin
MRQTRRDLLRTTGAALAVGGLAGCNAADSTTTETEADGASGGSAGGSSTESATETPELAPDASAVTAVAAEWNAMRARLHDAVALGTAESFADGAAYWASGGFDSQLAAETGWDEGTGAVQSGQSYVHTFETAGTHGYFCVPHEAAGMVGTVVVEE